MKRVAIYAHFDRKNEVKRYVTHFLAKLNERCERVEFVSTSQLSDSELDKVAAVTTNAQVKDNVGFDFGMWQHVLEQIDVREYDELILTNSSVFGPVHSLDAAFSTMAHSDCDFWAATDNHEIDWHLQSYFLVFRSGVLHSEAFGRFFASVLPYRKKWQVIRSYEIGLTQFLVQRGFKGEALNPAATLFPPWPLNLAFRRRKSNPSCFHPLRLLRHGMPFVKVEVFRDNPACVDLRALEREMQQRGYDPALIAFDRVEPPTRLQKLWKRTVGQLIDVS